MQGVEKTSALDKK